MEKITISIPNEVLVEWFVELEKIFSPSVKYEHDQLDMATHVILENKERASKLLASLSSYARLDE